MSDEPIILCENLVKIYRLPGTAVDASLEVQALQGLDLAISEGEMVGIVGVSGSGKSTLLNILGGLDKPSAGRVIVDKKNLGQMNQLAVDTYRRKTVGFVWQHGARNLIPYLTARENVRLPLTLSGEVGRETIERPEELLQLVGLGDRMHHRLEELSGGEQQRVAIAIALSNKPRLLLADEPTGELDTATAKTIYDLLRDLNRELGLTIVIVSHDTGIAKHVDRVVAVRDGKLASETVRVKKGDDASQEEHHFEELLVLDAAGRLALPHEYLEKFNIRRRVVLEITDEGILIRPPASGHHGNEHLHSAATAPESDSDEDIEGTEKAQANLLGRVKVWFANVKDKFKRQNSPQLQELEASGEKDQENENMQGGQQP